MEKKDYMGAVWFDPQTYNETIRRSAGYRDRVGYIASYLTRHLFLSDNEVTSLNLDNRFENIPFRLAVSIAARLTSFEFGDKHGVKYDVADARQIAIEIENLEYGRVAREKMTPVQKEYVALWAEEMEKLFADVKTMKRQFPKEAYERPSDSKERTMQDRMNELFK